jgi:probable HAF family extracellular repeat protein
LPNWCRRTLVPVSFMLIAPALPQTQQYFLTAQPGPAGFAVSAVIGIDDAGTAVGFVNQFGYCCDDSFLGDTPFEFRGAAGAVLNGPTGGHANAINNRGQVVGYNFNAPGFPFNEAVIWDNGTPKQIGILFEDASNFIGVSSAMAINDAGVVVGSSTTTPPAGNPNATAPQHAFSWKAGGKMLDLGALAIGSSTESSQANAISPGGVIVGQSVTAAGFTHAVQFQNGKVIDLGALEGAMGTSMALGASDAIIAGTSDGDAVVWQGGKIASLPTLGGIGGSAASVNSSGQIVGFSLNKAGEDRATLWQDGKAIDLNSLISPIGAKLPADTFLDDTAQITDNGLIEASYTTVSNDGTATTHAYLLTPVIPTHIAVSSTANPAHFGESVKIIVHVTAESGAPAASFVTIKDGATVLTRRAISDSGFLGYTTSALSVGSHSITVSYEGGIPDGPSTSSVFTQQVEATRTTTVLSSSRNPATRGQKFTLTAIVVPTFGAIAGNVTFKDGTTLLGTVKVDSRTREAALSTRIETTGRFALTAEYTGTADFGGSRSATLDEVVN